MRKKGLNVSESLFFAILLVSIVLFGTIYRNTIYIEVASKTFSLVLFAILTIVIGLVGTLVLSKDEKTRSIPIAIALGICPLSIYTFISYVGERPKAIILAIIICLVLIALYFVLMLKNRKVKNKLSRIGAMAIIIIAIVGLIPMGMFTAELKSGDGPIKRAEVNYKDNSATIQKELKTMKMFTPKRWAKLSLDEKKLAVETAKKIEVKNLGLSEDPKLVIKSIPVYESNGSVAGQYNSKTKTIFIDEDYLNRADKTGEDVLKTVCHECYHYYQQQLVKEWKKSGQKNLVCYSGADIWNQEYKSIGENDGTVFGQYSELTATDYAVAEAASIMNMIEALSK